ncbi:50S ribosomal protein L6, partial [Acinetobacter baumannii]
MSRIGKKDVTVPSGVQVTLNGQAVQVKGPKGQLAYTVPEEIEIAQANGALSLTPRS